MFSLRIGSLGLVLLGLALLTPVQAAQAQAVQFDPVRKIFILTTNSSSYAMGIAEDGELQHLYWGAPLWRSGDVPSPRIRSDISSFDPHTMIENEEYPGAGGTRFYEPSLKITRADGDRDLVLHYLRHEISSDTLDITMRDIKDPITVVLHYRLYPGVGIISRSTTIQNGCDQNITLESAQSAAWYVPHGEGYRLSYLSGRWAAESLLQQEPVQEGDKILESRSGHTGHNFNPWFALDKGQSDEEHGPVWFGALAWSGNWRITVEQTPYRQVRVTGGLNTYDFAYVLKPHEALKTPAFYGGFSSHGFGQASRQLHNLEREYIVPGGLKSALRPVLYNSWEATTFSVDEQGQIALADKAAKLGVEMFVMDDGWFGERDTDNAGLGDWVVNPRKFPHGLGPLIDHVTGLGMKFGLWVEPEMVNPNSNLYRAHPEWVMNFPGRPRSELRNQLVLNLVRDDVREYVFGFLDSLVAKNNIAYLKWDMNRVFAEPGWPEASIAEQKELWVKYVDNLYAILSRLRAKYPRLAIESCSGGGGRVDLGILRFVDEFWTSDNTEAFDRLRIQEGFSQAYSAKLMSAWVTDVPNTNGRSTPLKYRFLVAMQGALGIGANLNKWTSEDTAMATQMITLDKRIRKTVQLGDQHRLLSPRTEDTTANEYIAKNGTEAVVFAFRHSQQYNTDAPTIALRGLEPESVYHLESPDGKLLSKQTELSGVYLMEHGIDLKLTGDYDSTLLLLHRQH